MGTDLLYQFIDSFMHVIKSTPPAYAKTKKCFNLAKESSSAINSALCSLCLLLSCSAPGTSVASSSLLSRMVFSLIHCMRSVCSPRKRNMSWAAFNLFLLSLACSCSRDQLSMIAIFFSRISSE